MIAHVYGSVAEKFNNSVIVDVHGVGYEIQTPLGDYEHAVLGEEVKFYTYHHIREQSQDLFGFSTLAAKKLFELLITVQGVGPKAALAILGLGESETVRNAIANNDATYITKASGVGKKTAERVVVDLSDKVGMPLYYDNKTSTGISQAIEHSDEALEALMALGYNLNDASKALEGVSTELSTADRVTQALKG
ncbi:TPA: Holliday junction branch migration protein RuvA [Candidatus Saccharibacteria bacterium]|nr:MAG: Holliday junction ATP-dependent DNA helicase RuvA [Candidatus Saccharibacteria bacterium GW2011_GWC2_44_17]MBH1956807.1 Holliday junction branch migration protein RuvA [Candidatus Saccharibacteria bacterium]OGL24162.1 MAG: Holliday junction DNA helicase RuvA [Candidatus Saccharibacteria bacterium RIFCSPHIGHO2_01_FULL_46_30]OGL33830.1 MAG: Holliday junction DNA helicase RuvA [Candidatus Saccharibacteria bacterium RIFCSPHIGHO2_12_FULL_47_16]MBH1973405.1 Holliday junction branch migration 